MARTVVKSVAAAGVAAGLVFATAGVAFPAHRPPLSDPRTHLKPVEFINQTSILAQGLTPKAALARAHKMLKYPITTAHYVPRGFTLISERVFPPIQEPASDTQLFMKLSAARPAPKGSHTLPEVPSFEIDHTYGKPYVFGSGEAYFTTKVVKAGKRLVTYAEQKYTDVRKHKSFDLVWVYWYDTRTKLATEVTSELKSSKLTRADMLKIAASVR